jgi:serine/threonine-protein kinase RsbW
MCSLFAGFMPVPRCLVRLTIFSVFDTLDLIQVVSDRLSTLGGLDEDATHWVGVAVRESVINAIKHGNRFDPSKLVTIEFALEPVAAPTALTIRITDEGEGFDPVDVADPLAPENLLRSSGRGIFFMRSFMDEVTLQRREAGGMEVLMTKRLPSAESASA